MISKKILALKKDIPSATRTRQETEKVKGENKRRLLPQRDLASWAPRQPQKGGGPRALRQALLK